MFEFHSKKIQDCLKYLRTSENGLTGQNAARRIKRNGYNEIPKKQALGSVVIFFSQFNNVLIYILLIAGSLSLFLGETVDAGVIFGAIIINVVIGFIQENKANQAIVKLKQLVEHKAFVMRDGQEIFIDSRLITIGDVILLKAGNRIPADARIIEANDLMINESGLTGESMPAKKHDDEVKSDTGLSDRDNMVYAGTVIVNGLGKAVVTAIGPKTEIGKIAEMVRETREEKTPLQIRLSQFSRFLGLLFTGICALIVIIGLLQGRDLLEMIKTGVALGVASIPEGLTVAVTFILALGMQRILKQKALTRKLIAAETLGSITVICTDKTGTLTEGKMHVAHIVIGEKEFEMTSLGARQNEVEARLTELALQVGMMCNNASVENPDDELGSWRFIGSPTDSVLLSAAVQAGLRKEKLLKIEPRVDELPFTSENKFMLSLHKRSASEYILYEKGAPEKLLNKSIKYYHLGKIKKLGTEDKNKLIKTYENMTAKGLRVIGLALKEIKTETEFIKGEINWKEIDQELIFLGFIAIKDPLRPEAKETIRMCQEAGIRPIIITGDHRLTAQAIAAEVGLPAFLENIMLGEELDKISDEKLVKAVKKIDIFARVSPHHKLRIVKALQARGEVVAMTGDGINDSPALKAADIGIALGAGTDIAKETSDIVLLDDNFKTIVAAIEQGRVIFKNIRKIITYLISDSFSEVVLIVGSILLNTPLAVLPVQILWINIVNDGLPNFSLAFEKDHGHAMKEKPIENNEPLLTREMKIIIFGVGLARDFFLFGIFYYFAGIWDIDYLRTFIFAVLGVKSICSIFSIRSLETPIWKINFFSNRYLIAAGIASIVFLVLGIEWRPLQIALSTSGLTPHAWTAVIVFGLLNVLIIEFVKLFFIDKKIIKI